MWVWVDDDEPAPPAGRRRKGKPIPPRVEGDVAYVPLTQGMFAVIDASDVHLIEGCHWQIHRTPGRRAVYACALIDGKVRKMHHIILPIEVGDFIDHIDGDGLNNRRNNIRRCSPSQNGINSEISIGKSGFRGVTCDSRRRGKKWRATYSPVKGHRVSLGLFETAEDAARAYDTAAREAHGRFARLNFPEPGERAARKTSAT